MNYPKDELLEEYPATTEKKFICKEIFWWDGLEIIPPRPKLGLLSSFANRVEEEITEEDSSDEVSEEEFSSLSSSDSEEGSVECNPPRNEVVRKKKKRNTESKMWQHNLSARSNQDVQRAYEENAVKQMTAILNRNVINENVCRSGKSTMRNAIPLGGIWVRLETDWRESQNSLQPKTKNVFTAGKYNKFKGK